LWLPGRGQFWPQGNNLNNFGRGFLEWKLWALVPDKKIFENCILKTYFSTPWPTYATNWNGLNNFGRGPPRHHSCEVWSKSNVRFQRRRCLSKKVDGRRTTHDGRRTTTDDGQRPVTIAHSEHFVLRWVKKQFALNKGYNSKGKSLYSIFNLICRWHFSVLIIGLCYRISNIFSYIKRSNK